MTNNIIALIGNPNSGKTSLFNTLTKQNQRTANWPGMTVEKKSGFMTIDNKKFEIIDLPGCYSLNNNLQIDEKITTDFLLTSPPNLIINVINTCQLHKHLYLTIQLLETEIPMIMALSFIDQVSDPNIKLSEISKHINCPIIQISTRTKQGITQLISEIKKSPKPHTKLNHKILNKFTQPVLEQLPISLQKNWIATNLLEQNLNESNIKGIPKETITQQRTNIANAFDEEPEIIIADVRYNLIQKIISNCKANNITHKNANYTYLTDKILLHPILGLPIFLLIMYLMFVTCLVFGSSIQEPFAATCELWLVKVPLNIINSTVTTPSWLQKLLVNGIGTAVITTISFIPPLFLLFSALSILEQSGYMARAAFITDKLMSFINLPGRAFVSLLIGFGCNVPAIMSTRTLQNQQDRTLTAMMTPFMSCTARLALYVVLVQAFFKENGGIIIFSIYCIGIVAALITGFMLKKLVLKNINQNQIIELPEYIKPSIKHTITDSSRRIKRFCERTFRIMLPTCIILTILNNIKITNHYSLLEIIAIKSTIIFNPMGIEQSSWPTTIALIMGTIAKEVMVGVFHTLGAYNENLDFITIKSAAIDSIKIWHNWLYGQEKIVDVSQNLKTLFHNKESVIAFLIFSCLYLPCLSTLSALKKECSKKWGYIASFWSLLLAYSTGTLYYQWATITQHPKKTIMITALIILSFVIFLTFIKKFNKADKYDN